MRSPTVGSLPNPFSLLILGLVLILAACSQVTVTGTSVPLAETLRSPFTPTAPNTPVIAGDVEGAHLILAFIEAYNAGQVEAALALMDDQAQASDCDYEAVRAIWTGYGKDRVAEWLRQRSADHDQLIVRRIEGSSDVFAVEYSLRTNNTLRRLGFIHGIQPKIATKVILTSSPKRIASFANGPMGGDQSLCRPESS
ncbi:MAG TPA: hypothetical protein VFD70_22070 [Anaerolineae bacterium]|nr:hypothetical protein [Anaerolineae bacterium]